MKDNISIRKASRDDLAFVCCCIIDISRHLKAGENDLYIAALPDEVDESLRNWAEQYLADDGDLGLIAESDGMPVACLLAEITGSAFPLAGLGKVGHIGVCWVNEDFRKSGIAARLAAFAEQWFRGKGVAVVEVAYLAKNELAEAAWGSLGYRPFRVFAYKPL
ncbi:MAG: GNAT family N-acetyltransferase [Gammaproteobacteria bacterium]